MPARAEWRSRAHLARILRECLREGASIEIDGLGTFLPDARRGFRFISRHRPKVFVAYAQEDAANADRLFMELAEAGFDPWLDRHKLLPGQNWPRSIEQAIQNSDFIVACFSRRSVTKKGGFQAEIRYALDCMRHLPLDRIFLIPVRLDECRVPESIRRELQYIDLFPEWNRGVRKILSAIRTQLRQAAA